MVRNEVGSLFQVGYFDNDSEFYNLAFRLNGGSLYDGVVLDWWFYDPCGAGTADPLNQTNYGDFAGLCNYATGIPPDADYSASGEAPTNLVQCLMLGAAYVWGFAEYREIPGTPLEPPTASAAPIRATSIQPLRARRAGTTPGLSSAPRLSWGPAPTEGEGP